MPQFNLSSATISTNFIDDLLYPIVGYVPWVYDDAYPNILNNKDVREKLGVDDLLVDAQELHVLKDRPVKFELRTIDVLHNFYVPQFRGKMDMVPGIVTYYWLTPTRVGDFEVLCAEYCGTGHYAMRGRVVVDEEKEYKKWEAKQITFEKMLAKNRKNDNFQLVKKEK